EYDFTDTAGSCLDYLLNYTYDYVFLPAAEYTALTGDEYYSYKDSMFTLYTVKVPRETSDRTKKVNVTKEPFNILISGTDQEGYRSDVNMIATVNPVKHEVLLTSLPRDLYVTLPSFGEKDKLTHSRIYGLEETQAAIEQELGIDINYYVSVNFYALENIVDAIGGIDVESPCAFQTIGRDGYDIYYEEGMNHLDGREALAFCRERDSFESGDMTRNENQQAVLKAILEKGMSSSTILSSYTDVLAAATGSMFTTMSEDEMADLVKMQLKDMPGWEIKRHAIKGTPDMDYCYSLGQYASIVYPIEDEITMAVDEIAKTKLMD
ncbi:MAG: LCP family protein, partial [Firmicutes bacterium]|nr:LCP family protein [Bacillota bacterium]